MVTDHAEPTFALLRYSLGGYRPSKTDRLPGSPSPIQGVRLEHSKLKGGISLMTRTTPKGYLQRLPLMLSIKIE
jgi:hypothetical protein